MACFDLERQEFNKPTYIFARNISQYVSGQAFFLSLSTSHTFISSSGFLILSSVNFFSKRLVSMKTFVFGALLLQTLDAQAINPLAPLTSLTAPLIAPLPVQAPAPLIIPGPDAPSESDLSASATGLPTPEATPSTEPFQFPGGPGVVLVESTPTLAPALPTEAFGSVSEGPPFGASLPSDAGVVFDG